MSLGQCILFVLSEMSFETFPPIWSYVNKTRKKKWQKAEIRNFTIFLVETLPGSIHDLLGVNLLFTFRGDIV